MPALGHMVGLIQMFHAFQISLQSKRSKRHISQVYKNSGLQGMCEHSFAAHRHASISVMLDFVIASFCAQQQ